MINAQRDRGDDDKRDTTAFAERASREADALGQLENHAFALAGREGDDQRAARGSRQRRANGRPLTRAAIGCPAHRPQERVTDRSLSVEPAADGFRRRPGIDTFRVVGTEPIWHPWLGRHTRAIWKA